MSDSKTKLILAEMKATTEVEKDIIHLQMIIASIRPYSRWWRWGFIRSLRNAIKALESQGRSGPHADDPQPVP